MRKKTAGIVNIAIETIFVVSFFALAFAVVYHAPARAAGAGTLAGYAWSDVPDGNAAGDQGAGWIHFNGTNYGVTTDSAGNIAGYAWSDAVGWISFNAADVAGCPSGSCPPQLSLQNGAVTGWARALAATQAGAGGWDGWIHLSGSNYGVQIVNCSWTGYAWGGDVLGWIHFGGTNYGVVGSGGACATPTASISVNPTVLTADVNPDLTWTGSTVVTWSSTNSSTCDGTNFSTNGATSGNATVSITQTTLYSVTCTGAGGSGSASTPANAIVTVNYPSATAILHATPAAVHKNSTTRLDWSVRNVKKNTCTLSQNGTSWSQTLSNAAIESGSVTSPAITGRTTFILSCNGLDNTSPSASFTVTLIPAIQEL